MLPAKGRNENFLKRMLVKKITNYSRWVANILTMTAVLWPAVGLAGSDLAVPAELVYQMSLPGKGDHFLRPGRIVIDPRHNEIYVADQGNARIVILDQNGVYKFEFSVSEQCGMPLDIAVNSRGEILVLGSDHDGRGIFVFDFDGLYRRTIIPAKDSIAGEMISLAVDGNDRVYILGSGGVVTRYDPNGSRETSFPVCESTGAEEEEDVVFGALLVSQNGEIFVPASSYGTVFRYDTDGNPLGTIGHHGTGVGELSFPVAAAVVGDELVLVLDKHRFTVVCFNYRGKFLGEFGGKGVNPGWFYHPTWLAADINDRVYIGQIFGNKIQVCRIPESVRTRLSAGKDVPDNSVEKSGEISISRPADDVFDGYIEDSQELYISALFVRGNSWGPPRTSSNSPNPLWRFSNA